MHVFLDPRFLGKKTLASGSHHTGSIASGRHDLGVGAAPDMAFVVLLHYEPATDECLLV